MRIVNRLFIGDEVVPIVSHSLTLDADAPGRGIFTVRSETPLEGNVRLYVGIDGESPARYFTGVIGRCEKIDLRQRRLVVREYGEALQLRTPISLRNSPLQRAVEVISSTTGVGFRVSGNWESRRVPQFINSGSGFAALKLVAALADVPDFTIAFNADGTVYLGPRSELKRCQNVIVLQPRMFTALSAAGADLPFMPALRPGMSIRIGADGDDRQISAINVSGEKMRLALS